MDKIFGLMVHLGTNTWENQYECKKVKGMEFDREVWDKIVEGCAREGINTIVLALGEGLRYESHPELAIEGSWTHEEMKVEIERLKKLGIKIIPKMNFSAYHDPWLQEYGRSLISTPEYYKVCKDLIEEVYELFEHPEYIHLGLDEEARDDRGEVSKYFRRDEKLFRDWEFLFKCVHDIGAKVMMWGSTCRQYTDEEWMPHVSKEKNVIGCGHYYAYGEEDWTPLAEQDEWVRTYYATDFKKKSIYQDYLAKYGDVPMEYVEQDPCVERNIRRTEQNFAAGYNQIVIFSNIFLKKNTLSAIKYFSKHPCQNQIAGYIGCTWRRTLKENEEHILEEIKLLGEAKRAYLD